MNINESWLKEQLRNNQKFNPFSDGYDYEFIIEKIKGKEKEELDNYGLSIALNSFYFNEYFEECYDHIKSHLDELPIDIRIILQYIVALTNYNYHLISSETKEINDKGVFSFDGVAELQINNPFNKELNAISALEINVDILNVIINYFRYFPDHMKNQKITKEMNIEEMQNKYVKISQIANLYHVIKEAFDTMVWEKGFIYKNNENLYLKHINKKFLKIKHVGNLRYQSNITQAAFVAEDLKERLKSELNKKNANYYLRSVKLKSKKPLEIKLHHSSNNERINEFYLRNNAAISTYYPYFKDVELDNLNELTLDDVLFLFSQLQKLGNEIDNVKNKKLKLKNFIYKVRHEELVKFLNKTTKYSRKQVNSFIELITYEYGNKQRVNLWEETLLKIDNEYHICLMNLISANVLCLIDEWLNYGGVHLKKRGKLFEEYLKRSLDLYIKEKNYYCHILTENNFSISRNKYEEIDLLMKLKDVNIIGEIKCIKFPNEPRDFYNAYKRLKKGAEQIIRKKQFISDNKDYFSEFMGNIEGKELIGVVITNYPMFTGIDIKGVKVIDSFLFESYFASGELTKNMILGDKNKNVKTIKYYEDEEGMSKNIKEFINNPIPVKDKLNRVSIKYQHINFDESDPQIFINYPKIEEDKLFKDLRESME